MRSTKNNHETTNHDKDEDDIDRQKSENSLEKDEKELRNNHDQKSPLLSVSSKEN